MLHNVSRFATGAYKTECALLITVNRFTNAVMINDNYSPIEYTQHTADIVIFQTPIFTFQHLENGLCKKEAEKVDGRR